LSNHNCDRSRRDFEPCDFLISAIDFSQRLSALERYGALTAQREPPNVQQRMSNSQFRAVANPSPNKSVINAALQNSKVMRRIKMALTYWHYITF